MTIAEKKRFTVNYYRTTGRLPARDRIEFEDEGLLDNSRLLQEAFRLPPDRAIGYLKSKGHQITWSHAEMRAEAHRQAFTVAKAMSLDVLQLLHNRLVEAQREGKPFKEFAKGIQPELESAGWWGKKEVEGPDGKQKVQLGSPSRLRTIFQTNLQSAANAGRFQQQLQASVYRPYLQYISIVDSRTSEICAKLHGKVFRADDAAWRVYYPPNHHNCRATVRSLSQRDLGRMGVEVSDGSALADLQPAKGFAAAPTEPWEPDLSKYAPGLARAYEKAQTDANPVRAGLKQLAEKNVNVVDAEKAFRQTFPNIEFDRVLGELKSRSRDSSPIRLSHMNQRYTLSATMETRITDYLFITFDQTGRLYVSGSKDNTVNALRKALLKLKGEKDADELAIEAYQQGIQSLRTYFEENHSGELDIDDSPEAAIVYGQVFGNASVEDVVRSFIPERTLKDKSGNNAFPSITGLSMKLNEDGHIAINLQADTVGKGGRKTLIHQMTRTFSFSERHGKVASHDGLLVDGEFQGQGIASNLIKQSFEMYIRQGLDLVDVSAALTGGHQVWMKYGFDFGGEKDSRVFKASLKKYMEEKGVSPDVADQEIAGLRHAWDYIDYSKALPTGNGTVTISGAEWKRKNPFSWHGVFDLRDNSPSRRRLEQYIGIPAATAS